MRVPLFAQNQHRRLTDSIICDKPSQRSAIACIVWLLQYTCRGIILFAIMKSSLFALVSLFITLSYAYTVDPPTTAPSDTIQDCKAYSYIKMLLYSKELESLGAVSRAGRKTKGFVSSRDSSQALSSYNNFYQITVLIRCEGTNWVVVSATDTCQAISDSNGITLAQFDTYVSCSYKKCVSY
jgi:hypothetical protein